MTTLQRGQAFATATLRFLWANKHHVLAGTLLLLWCLPYFLTGNNIEWGDFSFFAQGAEAIRASIMDFGQFPWFNPWVAGGVPLYGNPQFGVFSIQTLLSLPFGAVMGLKLAMVLYTIAGYASMYVLTRKYFKLSAKISVVLGLLWIFSSFFVAHIPSHYTFAWYMLGPLFFYLALTFKTWRGGLVFGGAFAIMGLAQIHNAFFHIAVICAVIIVVRLIRGKTDRKALLLACLAAAGIFLLVAGHRAIVTVENVREFPRLLSDNAAQPTKSVLGVLLPFSNAHDLHFIKYPAVPFGWGELTATIGIFANIAMLISASFLLYRWRDKPNNKQKLVLKYATGILALALVVFIIGMGNFAAFSPYGILKHLPILGDMRVSSRWFAWFMLLQLIFIGWMLHHAPKSFFRTLTKGLLVVGVLELFVLNVGYQANVLSHPVTVAPNKVSSYQFMQTNLFGETPQLPNGATIPDDGQLTHFYREYEATTFNTGVLRANDALVDLNTKETPRCGVKQGCELVLTGNATVTYWSPGKIVLKRTAPGDIKLNMNNSNYFLVNGQRNTYIRATEPYRDFTISTKDSDITIEVSPSLTLAASKILQKYEPQK